MIAHPERWRGMRTALGTSGAPLSARNGGTGIAARSYNCSRRRRRRDGRMTANRGNQDTGCGLSGESYCAVALVRRAFAASNSTLACWILCRFWRAQVPSALTGLSSERPSSVSS